MNDAGKYALMGIGAVAKLVITGICLAIGFKIGNVIVVEAEKKLAKKPVVA
jgi:hypothetical protein